MKYSTLVLLTLTFIVGATPAAPAQTSSQFQACSKSAKTQLALNMCASGELTMRNIQMQSVYSAILSRVAANPAALAKVKSMQNDWLVYATAYLAALYPATNKQAEYGSIYPMSAALARAALVRTHTADLQALLAHLKRP